MVDNPLEKNPAREHRVRERAYHLWEADGKPYGRDVEYWERARELVAIEDSAGAGQLPNPQAHPESVRETGVEEAEIQENLGEFPDRFADQGDVQATPIARHSPRHEHEPAPAAASQPATPAKAKDTAATGAAASKSAAPKTAASKSAAPKPAAGKTAPGSKRTKKP
jgi:hypothetical protein